MDPGGLVGSCGGTVLSPTSEASSPTYPSGHALDGVLDEAEIEKGAARTATVFMDTRDAGDVRGTHGVGRPISTHSHTASASTRLRILG